MVAKRFAYICAGLLMLTLTYHFGARTAVAQVAGADVVGMIATNNVCGDAFIAVTSSGDVYGNTGCAGVWAYRGNIFGGPVPVEKTTLGQLKARWR